MQVNIDDLAVAMPLGNNGVTFTVYENDGTYLGKFRVGKGTVEWCHGRTQIGNGAIVSWTDLIKYFESD